MAMAMETERTEKAAGILQGFAPCRYSGRSSGHLISETARVAIQWAFGSMSCGGKPSSGLAAHGIHVDQDSREV